MSRLVVGTDDHPEAARKHADDARALKDARRYDGAAYLAGYVVECALKSVLLHDRSYDPITGKADPAKLAAWHKQLSSRPFGHDLAAILTATVGSEGARYLPPLHVQASIVREWKETMRYWAPSVPEEKAAAFLDWAEVAVQSVVQMQLDGVA